MERNILFLAIVISFLLLSISVNAYSIDDITNSISQFFSNNQNNATIGGFDFFQWVHNIFAQATPSCNNDNNCTSNEDCQTCPTDCPCALGTCQNHQCVGTTSNCNNDNICTSNEDCTTCSDCKCDTAHGYTCVNHACAKTGSGGTTTPTTTTTPHTTATSTKCGNGVVDSGEVCDTGKTGYCEGCQFRCHPYDVKEVCKADCSGYCSGYADTGCSYQDSGICDKNCGSDDKCTGKRLGDVCDASSGGVCSACKCSSSGKSCSELCNNVPRTQCSWYSCPSGLIPQPLGDNSCQSAGTGNKCCCGSTSSTTTTATLACDCNKRCQSTSDLNNRLDCFFSNSCTKVDVDRCSCEYTGVPYNGASCLTSTTTSSTTTSTSQTCSLTTDEARDWCLTQCGSPNSWVACYTCGSSGCQQLSCYSSNGGGYISCAQFFTSSITTSSTTTTSSATSTNPQITIDGTTYQQGTNINFVGTGFTPNGRVSGCMTDTNADHWICFDSSPADSQGKVSGTFQVGYNILLGPQKFRVNDVSSLKISNSIQVQITSAASTSTTTTIPAPSQDDIVFVPLNFNPGEDAKVQQEANKRLDFFKSVTLSGCPALTTDVKFIPAGACTETCPSDAQTGPTACFNYAQQCAYENGYGGAKRIVGLYNGVWCLTTDTFGCRSVTDGMGTLPGTVSVVAVGELSGVSTLAHELGHNFGLCHMSADATLGNDCMTPSDSCQSYCPNQPDCSLPDSDRSVDIMSYCQQKVKYNPAAYDYITPQCTAESSVAASEVPQKVTITYMTFYKDNRTVLNSIKTDFGYPSYGEQGSYVATLSSSQNTFYQAKFSVNFNTHADGIRSDGTTFYIPISLDKVDKLIVLPYSKSSDKIKITSADRPAFNIGFSSPDSKIVITNEDCHPNQPCKANTEQCSDNLKIIVNYQGEPLSNGIVVDDKAETSFTPSASGQVRVIAFCFSPNIQVTTSTLDIS